MKRSLYTGLILSILVLIIFLLMPNFAGMITQVKYYAGVTSLMAIWWITEAISIYEAAFVPLVLFQMLEIFSISDDMAENYDYNLVLLLLGGLILIARAIEKQNPHKRIILV
ncbi:MAG: anion permease [Flavobacteriales bacterium]